MGQHEHAGDALHPLQGERALLVELPSTPFAALEEFGLPGFRLGKAPFGALLPAVYGFLRAADLFVRPLEKLGEGELDVGCNALDLRHAILARLLKKRH